MYIKYLMLLLNLFVCASCKLIEEPFEIRYTHTDKFNMYLKLINLPKRVVEYYLRSVILNHTNVIKHGQVNMEDYVKIFVNTTGITADQIYSIELWKSDGNLCSSKDVCLLIAQDIYTEGTEKHECFIKEKACQIQIDFRNKCNIFRPYKMASELDYQNNVTDTHGTTWDKYFRSPSIIFWLVPVIVGAVFIAGAITCVLYNCCQYRNKHTESPDHTHVSAMEVVYTEINPQVHCTADKPKTMHKEEPYATVIGVLRNDQNCQDVVPWNNLH